MATEGIPGRLEAERNAAESVGEARLERRGAGVADLVIPVKDVRRTGTFQGAVGFSRKTDGSYVASGAAGLSLRNIAGSGRGAAIDWLNDGESYSRIALRFHEPFFLSRPLSVDVEMAQIVQDSSYIFSAGALSFGIPVGPATTIIAGVAADRSAWLRLLGRLFSDPRFSDPVPRSEESPGEQNAVGFKFTLVVRYWPGGR